ncbi:MAG: M18 family aminopeptidase [Lachnospiraceae bacterium]|nr:M18 family aminopeptidase [Lachnospiraceae bacterium]
MELFEYLNGAVTPYHAVELGAEFLAKAGFTEQKLAEPFDVERGKGYFIRVYGTGLVAYTVGGKFKAEDALHLAVAHTDAPCLRVKPVAELLSGEYKRLDVEVYGGAILNTWFDRPLSLAGRVVLRGKDAYSPQLVTVDMKRPLLTVPNLAIHMNREVNKGVEYKPQRDLLPLMGMLKEGESKEAYLRGLLAKELQVKEEEILDYDLTVYCAEQACYLGEEEEFISAPRLDNQLSCYALLEAISAGTHASGICMAVLYDHEEIGSRSKQGADSALTGAIIERIYAGLGLGREIMQAALAKSIMLSVDGAHALHPNRQDVYDPVNRATVNKGIALKINSSQRYAFDTETVAVAQVLCEEAGVLYQKVANHSDQAGGSTLGPILSSWIPMRAIDLGVPLLAMHSARELAGKADVDYLLRFLTKFYS